MTPDRVSSGNPFTRKDIALARSLETLRPATWKKAHVFKLDWLGQPWVVKDFRRSSWLFRQFLGPLLTRREIRALSALQGVRGTPADAFRIDSLALAYRYVPGESMRQLRRRGVTLDAVFFTRLETIVKEMHARGVLHLDLRNAWNILATADQEPHLLDFQSSMRSRLLPRPLRRLLETVDLSGAYKWWVRLSPATFDAARDERLRKLQQARRFWPFRRFFLTLDLRSRKRLDRPRRLPARAPAGRGEDGAFIGSGGKS